MSNEWKDYDNDIRESIKDICRCEEVCPGEDCLRIETEPCVVKCLLDKCEIAQAQSKTFKSELIAWESAYDSLGDELVSMRKRVAEWRQKWHDLKHVEMKELDEIQKCVERNCSEPVANIHEVGASRIATVIDDLIDNANRGELESLQAQLVSKDKELICLHMEMPRLEEEVRMFRIQLAGKAVLTWKELYRREKIGVYRKGSVDELRAALPQQEKEEVR